MRTGMEWDKWYHELCVTVAKKSQCLSRKIGSVLVRDRAVVSQGYNGPPKGVQTCDLRWTNDSLLLDEYNKRVKAKGRSDKFLKAVFENDGIYKEYFEGKCPRYVPEMGFKSGQGLEWCVAGHAERNSLINAARYGIATDGTILYMDCGMPCTPCLVEIINAGVKEIVVTSFNSYDVSAPYTLKQSDLKMRMYQHLCPHENYLQENGYKFSIIDGYCPDCGKQLREG